jgi:hypothetical protein
MMVRRIVLGLFALNLGVTAGVALARADWACLIALPAGWYLADLASGLVHIVLDYRPCPVGRGLGQVFFYEGSRESADYGALRTRVMAGLTPFQRILYDFKSHHPRPDALGRRTLWHQVGPTLVIAALPAAIALNLAARWPGTPGWVLAGGLALVLGGGLAQYFHAGLHRRDPPWPIRALRRLRLLMTPAAHQLHHDTLQRDFATNCGWSNPMLNALFRALRNRGLLDDAGLVPRD